MSYLFCVRTHTHTFNNVISSFSFVLIRSHTHKHSASLHSYDIPFNLIEQLLLLLLLLFSIVCVSCAMRICHKFEKHEDIMFSHIVSFSSIYCYWYYRCWILSLSCCCYYCVCSTSVFCALLHLHTYHLFAFMFCFCQHHAREIHLIITVMTFFDDR